MKKKQSGFEKYQKILSTVLGKCLDDPNFESDFDEDERWGHYEDGWAISIDGAGASIRENEDSSLSLYEYYGFTGTRRNKLWG